MDVHWLTFLGVVSVLTITPGPDLVLVTRAALARGLGGAARTLAGIAAGLATWALLAAFGVAALVAASDTAFTVLKLAGAAYLVYMGVRALLAAWRGAPAAEDRATVGGFRRGLVTNLLNPKIGVFYTAFLPQFVERGEGLPVAAQVLVLAAVQIAVGCGTFLAYAAFVARAGDALRGPRVARTLDAVAGTVLVTFGIRLVLLAR